MTLEYPVTETAERFPEWFEIRRAAAAKRYQALAGPKRGDEQWRFSALRELPNASALTGAPKVSAATIERLIQRSRELEDVAARFVFVNEKLVHHESNLADGPVCLTLAEALVRHPKAVEAHFMANEPRLGSEKFAALHESRVTAGVFIEVPAGTEIKAPIEIHHWISGEATVFPHTLIVTGANSSVRVVEIHHSGDEEAPGISFAVNDLHAGPGSQLCYVMVQDLNLASKMIQINETLTERDSTALAFSLHIGAGWARAEAMSQLVGTGSTSNMISVAIPAGDQQIDQRTLQHHRTPGARSDLLYKNILHDEANSIFSGLISVDVGAHQTDAYQTCRNLLMSDAAEANSLPGLEINADEVRCSHGSTASRISDEEIFYLRTRGIDPEQARQLIARGFANEAVSRIGAEAIEETVLRFIDAKFARIANATTSSPLV